MKSVDSRRALLGKARALVTLPVLASLRLLSARRMRRCHRVRPGLRAPASARRRKVAREGVRRPMLPCRHARSVQVMLWQSSLQRAAAIRASFPLRTGLRALSRACRPHAPRKRPGLLLRLHHRCREELRPRASTLAFRRNTPAHCRRRRRHRPHRRRRPAARPSDGRHLRSRQLCLAMTIAAVTCMTTTSLPPTLRRRRRRRCHPWRRPAASGHHRGGAIARAADALGAPRARAPPQPRLRLPPCLATVTLPWPWTASTTPSVMAFRLCVVS